MRIADTPRLPKLSIALALACGAFAFAPESLLEHCALNREDAMNGEWWRLWTSHLVHFSPRHACVDLCVLLATGTFVEIRHGSGACSRLLLFAMPLLSCALLLVAPDLAQYRGASGLCALYVTILWLALWREVPAWRWSLLLIALCFAIKTGFEMRGAAINVAGLSRDIFIVWQVHMLGAAIGVLWFLSKDYPGRPAMQTI